MKKTVLYILLFSAIVQLACSQASLNVDSLKKQISLSQKNDSLILNQYKLLCGLLLANSEFDSVLIYANKALALAIEQKNYMRETTFYSAIGVAYWNKSDYDKAIKSYEKGLKRIEETGETSNLSALYNNIGLAYWDKSDFPKALDYFIKSMEIDSKNNDKGGMSSSLLNIGLVYSDMNDFKKALIYYYKSLVLCSQLGDESGKALAYINIGQIYSKTKEIQKSMEYDLKALAICERIGDKKNLALVNTNIGSLYSALSKPELALKHYNESLKYNELIGNMAGLVLTLNNMADALMTLKREKEAILVLERALKIEKDYFLLDEEAATYEGLAKAYSLTNNFKSAYFNYVYYNKLNDSLTALRNLNAISNIQKTLELTQKENELNLEKEKELAIKDAEKQKQVFITVGTIMILGLTLVFAAFLYKRFQITSRQKNIIEKQKHIVEEHQKEILDSIHYAKRIQYTLLAHDDLLKQNLNDHFVLFKPKDVVSGDFYWATKKGNKFYLAVCDSTGHGVPGAFMSLLNISFLNEAITEKNIELPHLILNHVRQRLIENISKDGGQDGMDGILVCMDTSTGEITYAAANNAPLIISSGITTELYADKMPVGKGERTDSFQLNTIATQPGDILYLYTDGFADQFGGPKGKKYKYKQLNDLLLNNANKSLNEQKEILNASFDNWKGSLEQVDDVCIIGVRV